MTFKITPHNIGYITGLFEGEGSVGYYISKLKNGNQYRKIKLEISMTDEFPVELFWDIVGVGKLYDFASYQGNKHIYRFVAHTYEDVQHIVCLMWQYLSPRRQEQCRKTLNDYVNYVGMDRIPPIRSRRGCRK